LQLQGAKTNIKVGKYVTVKRCVLSMVLMTQLNVEMPHAPGVLLAMGRLHTLQIKSNLLYNKGLISLLQVDKT